ncbi:Mitochondrial import inner membrane translocase subunit tim8 [Elasticomyces elasticus]|nr:Mitochondrial import inner membrane translocase subunit tim8 [Elasticomyces elasticus]
MWHLVLYLLVLFVAGTQSREVGNVDLLADDKDLGPPFTAEKAVNWNAFNAHKAKGDQFISFMECPNTDQSFWTDREALFDNGWVMPGETDVPASPEPQPFPFLPVAAQVYDWLGISPDYKKVEYNLHYSWDQDKEADQRTTRAYGPFPAGTKYGAIEAAYENIFNPRAGMIICYSNYSPAFRVSRNHYLRPADIPPLNRLSDVLWYQWKDAVAATHSPDLVSNVKWIMRHKVIDATSTDIIDTINGEQLQDWPGKTYDMSAATGSDSGLQERSIARALLGSPNGVGVVHFLAQHRADLGFKSVSKVQSWADANGRYMLFHIIDIKEYDIL